MNAEYDYALCKALPVVGRGAGGLPAPKCLLIRARFRLMVALVNSLLLCYYLTDCYEIWHVDVKMNGEYDYALFNAFSVVGRGAGGLPAPKCV